MNETLRDLVYGHIKHLSEEDLDELSVWLWAEHGERLERVKMLAADKIELETLRKTNQSLLDQLNLEKTARSREATRMKAEVAELKKNGNSERIAEPTRKAKKKSRGAPKDQRTYEEVPVHEIAKFRNWMRPLDLAALKKSLEGDLAQWKTQLILDHMKSQKAKN